MSSSVTPVSVSPAEFSTHYGNYSESIRTHELDHYSHAYIIILVILFVVIIIILAYIAINLDNIVQDLQKKIIVPVTGRMDSTESKLASIEARTSEVADRVRDWDLMATTTFEPEAQTMPPEKMRRSHKEKC